MVNQVDLGARLENFLPGQRWFGAKSQDLGKTTLIRAEVLHEPWPALVRAEVEVGLEEGSHLYQILIGLRPQGSAASFLEESSGALIGEVGTDSGRAMAYEATRDPELALELFSIICPQLEPPERVRPMGAEQSNSSLIFDDRLVLKIFRRLSGRSLELEMISALSSAGFTHIADVLAEWQSDEHDLGVVQAFLAGGVEGRAMAVTSLRDFYRLGGDPSQAGGDFAAESERLGQTTAEMHVALARSLGKQPGDPNSWADSMEAQLLRNAHPGLSPVAAAQVFDRLRSIEDPGPAIRVHGDFHLGQVMRTDKGWFVFDFEGEPARPPEERRLPTSPLKDVAGILRSLQYAAQSVMLEYRAHDGQPSADGQDRRAASETEAAGAHERRLANLALAWEQRNRQAFLEGYVAVAHQHDGLLPKDTASMEMVLTAFELDKAIYEIGYEMAHRPDWVGIPLAALGNLLNLTHQGIQGRQP